MIPAVVEDSRDALQLWGVVRAEHESVCHERGVIPMSFSGQHGSAYWGLRESPASAMQRVSLVYVEIRI